MKELGDDRCSRVRRGVELAVILLERDSETSNKKRCSLQRDENATIEPAAPAAYLNKATRIAVVNRY